MKRQGAEVNETVGAVAFGMPVASIGRDDCLPYARHEHAHCSLVSSSGNWIVGAFCPLFASLS
jgi:hypothetical protein